VSKIDLTFLLILALFAIHCVFDLGILSVLWDLVKRKDS
jgi:hypothetical protein